MPKKAYNSKAKSLNTKSLKFYAILVLGLIFLDQFTKNAIWYMMDGTLEILPFFSLVKVLNTGVSFGIMREFEGAKVLFSIIAILVSLVLCFMIYTSKSNLARFSYALIISGALGNTIDRVRLGGVIDFLDFHAFGMHYPAFNVADSVIFIGTISILFEPLIMKVFK